jgi:hypothetical protein
MARRKTKRKNSCRRNIKRKTKKKSKKRKTKKKSKKHKTKKKSRKKKEKIDKKKRRKKKQKGGDKKIPFKLATTNKPHIVALPLRDLGPNTIKLPKTLHASVFKAMDAKTGNNFVEEIKNIGKNESELSVDNENQIADQTEILVEKMGENIELIFGKLQKLILKIFKDQRDKLNKYYLIIKSNEYNKKIKYLMLIDHYICNGLVEKELENIKKNQNYGVIRRGVNKVSDKMDISKHIKKLYCEKVLDYNKISDQKGGGILDFYRLFKAIKISIIYLKTGFKTKDDIEDHSYIKGLLRMFSTIFTSIVHIIIPDEIKIIKRSVFAVFILIGFFIKYYLIHKHNLE